MQITKGIGIEMYMEVMENNEGKAMLDFATTYDLVIASTRFKKQDEHVNHILKGRINHPIDYFLMRQEN